MSDVGSSFVYPFRHPAWLGRVLVGAGLEVVPVLVALPLMATLGRKAHRLPPSAVWLLPLVAVVALAVRFLVLGYLGRAAREIVDGSSTGLPAWDQMGDDVVLGFKVFLVGVALWLPAIAVTGGLALLVMSIASPALAWLPVILVGPPAALLTLAYLPAGLIAALAARDISRAFDVDSVTTCIGRAFGAYALAFLVALGSEIIAQFGLLLCCVGIFATRFVAHCVAVHAFASAYRAGLPAPAAPPVSSPTAPAP